MSRAGHWIWLGTLVACGCGVAAPVAGATGAEDSGGGNVGGGAVVAGPEAGTVDRGGGGGGGGDRNGDGDGDGDGVGDGERDASAEAGALVGSGTITYERWNNVRGESVALVPVDRAPDVTMQLTLFQAPSDVGQDFGARLRGFLTAPATGNYTFWISCDDNGELDLSTDELPANKRRIAHVTGSPAWTDYVEWTKFPTQKSQPIALIAGTRYYVEALLKEDVAEDHLAVGWLKPGEVGVVPSEIIPGKQLSPAKP